MDSICKERQPDFMTVKNRLKIIKFQDVINEEIEFLDYLDSSDGVITYKK